MSASIAQLLVGAALAAGGVPPPAVQQALRRAAPDGAEVQVAEYRESLPRGCLVQVAEIGAVSRSSAVPLRLRGRDDQRRRPCSGWGMAQVTLIATVAVASRAIPEGHPLEGAVRLERRELRGSARPAPELARGAMAARAIAAGQVIDEAAVAPAGVRRPGEAITVLVAQGPLRIERPGRLLPCGRGRGCALLPGGARVEGTLEGNRLLVEVP